MNPKVSIIIPVYNAEEHLENCLSSVLNQTLYSLEVIAINDGSTDRSLEILKHFANQDQRLKVIDQLNQGVSATRNKGLSLAQGEYIGFVDSDDFVSPYMFNLMYSYAIEKKADIVVCNLVRFNNFTELYLDKEYSNFRVDSYTKGDAIKKYISGEISGYLWDKIFRRKLLIENNIHCPENTFAEDMFPVLQALDCSQKVIKLDIDLYYYRYTQGSASDVNNIKKLECNLIEHSNQIKKCTQYLESKYSVQLKNEIIQFKLYQFINQLYFYNKIISSSLEMKERDLKYYLNDYYTDLTLIKVIGNRHISLQYKIRYILWNLGLYSIYLNTKTK